jgi:hypothetical protein
VHQIDQPDARVPDPKRLQLVQLAGSGDESSRVDIDVATGLIESESTCGGDHWH